MALFEEVSLEPCRWCSATNGGANGSRTQECAEGPVVPCIEFHLPQTFVARGHQTPRGCLRPWRFSVLGLKEFEPWRFPCERIPVPVTDQVNHQILDEADLSFACWLRTGDRHSAKISRPTELANQVDEAAKGAAGPPPPAVNCAAPLPLSNHVPSAESAMGCCSSMEKSGCEVRAVRAVTPTSPAQTNGFGSPS